MKALVWHGERALALEELPDPTTAEGEVVVEVELAGICGSDLHGYRGHPGPRVPPLVLGHEVVGRVGDGTYTVYPLAGCVGALQPHTIDSESRVLVLGCGPIGLLTVFACARAGAQVTALDPVPARRAHAMLLGAEAALGEVPERDAVSFDLAVDAAGFEATWQSAVGAVRNGGSLVVVGLGQATGSMPMAEIVRRSVHVRGQFAYSRADFAAAVEILSAGDLALDWVVERPLSDGARAFADLVDRPAEVTKVLLRP